MTPDEGFSRGTRFGDRGLLHAIRVLHAHIFEMTRAHDCTARRPRAQQAQGRAPDGYYVEAPPRTSSSRRTRAKIASNIAWVRRPVCVFWRLG
jgi:hypothetical protein